MIEFEHVGVRYEGAADNVLTGVNLTIGAGELCLVVGRTGSGKSTLLRCVNGLVPHFTGGTLSGRVLVDGRDTRTHRPRELADVVGFVGQDPQSGFVAATVEDELAFGMEWLGLAPNIMRRRVEETLDLLGLAEVRRRAMSTLSGGQQQRVAIGAALTAHPRVLVLDEPTSALDPQAAEDVLAALQRLVHDLGTTVLLAEHRLERVVQYADQVIQLRPGGAALAGPPAEAMHSAPVAPPVVELGRLAGWSPLPLSIRDARRAATELSQVLAGQVPLRRARTTGPSNGSRAWSPRLLTASGGRGAAATGMGAVRAEICGLAVRYGTTVALRGVDLQVTAGEIVAVMGRNGAGKSTLLASLVGLAEPASGTIRVGGLTPCRTSPEVMIHAAGLVPQEPTDLLYADTVAAECDEADSDTGAESGSCRALLTQLAPDVVDDEHPRDLSEGQRLALALSVILVAQPPLLLLDEPTRGLDYPTKRRLSMILRDLAADGHAVMLATHDVELVAELATRVVVVADGEVVADGPTAEVVVGSPVFAPQVAKVLAPQHWLTVGEVANALKGVPFGTPLGGAP